MLPLTNSFITYLLQFLLLLPAFLSTQRPSQFPSYLCLHGTMTGPTDTLNPRHATKDREDAPVSIQDEKKLKQWFIGSIDQGTTSTRFLIFDGTGSPIASHQMEFKQMYPHSGLVYTHQTSTTNAVTALTDMQMDRA